MLRRTTVTEVSVEGIEMRYRNNNSADYEQRQTTPDKWPER
jgi:hypothetical protein